MDEMTQDAFGDLHVRSLHLRAIREGSREADFIASTDDLDDYGEVVLQNWDLQSRFLKNPVILWSHNARELPIGQATRCEVKNGNLECTIKFASEKANARAEQVWLGVLEKTIRAVSVGFKPGELRYELRDGKEVCVLDKNILYEISCVALPANSEALAKMKAKALADFRSASAPAPAATTPTAPERGNQTKDSDMDEKQKAALELKIAEHEKALRDLESKHAAEKQRADKAEAEAKTLAAQTERLATERDAMRVERDALDAQLVDIEVSGLVGKKITPAEKADFIELRKTNKTLFERMVGQRSEMTHQTPVIPPQGNAAPATPPAAAEAADWDRVEKLASSSAA